MQPPLYTLILKEVSDELLKTIPESVSAKWLKVIPGRPVIGSPIPKTTYIMDGACIVVSSGPYTLTASVNEEDATINLAVNTAVGEDGTSTIVSKRNYQLSDPSAIEKSVGYMVKSVRDYVCPYVEKI